MEGVVNKQEILRQLREKLEVLEGFRPLPQERQLDFGLGPMADAFPGRCLPMGAVHEFISPSPACAAASTGFISGLLSTLMKNGSICLWVSTRRSLFPPALKSFGIEPHQVIFVDVRNEKEALWTMEQGLKCKSLSAVVAELREVSFDESRRLQLAVEESRVTGFLHRLQPRSENTLACVSRWKIRPLPSVVSDGLPGVGFPLWEVELVKIRNGRPGIWSVGWRDGAFHHTPVTEVAMSQVEKRYA
ncbi:MAG: Error-prone repair protein ImuA [Bacteroidota bacterium]|nr:Error-prone repair protein ImuA [Bacteroidota bacterium]